VTITNSAPAGDPDFDSLIADFEQREGGDCEEQLLEQQVTRELRTLRAREIARQRFEEEVAAGTKAERIKPLDWADFLNRDLSKVEWIAGKLLAKGQQASLVGEGKAGKSLLAMEWAWRAAAGLPFLSDVARPPMRVLYVDHENSHDVIQARLRAFGATEEQLKNLTYLSFAAMRPLTTKGGGEDLLEAVRDYASELVFLDTISRMVSGKENESDTWLELYRHSLMPLKSSQTASVRLDHFGKDPDRGARGSSAKTQDIDVVWELHAKAGDRVDLKRSHSRTGIGDGFFALRRLGQQVGDRWAPGMTRHVVVEGGGEEPAGEVVKALAKILNDASVPVSWGRPKVGKWLRDEGHRHADAIVRDVVKYRQENPF
jgi:hypothetical protein